MPEVICLYCPNCGRRLLCGGFCSNCGADLAAFNVPAQTPGWRVTHVWPCYPLSAPEDRRLVPRLALARPVALVLALAAGLALMLYLLYLVVRYLSF